MEPLLPFYKRCSKCRKEKLNTEFGNVKNNSSRLNCYCKKCANENSKEWVKNNPDKRKESSNKYYHNNKDKQLEYNKEYRLKNIEKRRKYERERAKRPEVRKRLYEYAKKWKLNNKERYAKAHRKRNKRYYEKNKDKIRAGQLDWERRNRDKTREKARKRRARIYKTRIGKVPTIEEQLSKQGGMCANCKIKGKKVKWELDHIIALSRGGTHTSDNVQVLCHKCNGRKWAKTPEQWALENGRLL